MRVYSALINGVNTLQRCAIELARVQQKNKKGLTVGVEVCYYAPTFVALAPCGEVAEWPKAAVC